MPTTTSLVPRPLTALKILVIEDNPRDREILRYLLESRFHPESKIMEASNLREGVNLARHKTPDCIILDLGLPDSVGPDTFKHFIRYVPSVPIIVMTNNKDRDQALELVEAGAADFLIKNFTDEEDIFRRLMFAVTKHRNSVRITPEKAGIFRRLDQVQEKVSHARRRQSRTDLQEASAESTLANAEMSRHLLAEVQRFSEQLAQQDAKQEYLLTTVANLDKELLRGRSGRPSMRSQMDLLEHRVTTTEAGLGKLKENVDEAGDTQRREALQLTRARWDNRTKLLIALLTLFGVVATAVATYFAAIHKPPEEKPDKPETSRANDQAP